MSEEVNPGGRLSPGEYIMPASKAGLYAAQKEVRTVSATGGEKGVKMERYDLIPVEPLRLLAHHYGVGATKYEDDNWRRGYEWRKSFGALMRHLEAFRGGEDIDEETGSPHIIAVAWHAFTLSEFMRIHPDYDDRIKS